MVLAALFFIYRMSNLTRIDAPALTELTLMPGFTLPRRLAAVVAYSLNQRLAVLRRHQQAGDLLDPRNHPEVVILGCSHLLKPGHHRAGRPPGLSKSLHKRGCALLLCNPHTQIAHPALERLWRRGRPQQPVRRPLRRPRPARQLLPTFPMKTPDLTPASCASAATCRSRRLPQRASTGRPPGSACRLGAQPQRRRRRSPRRRPGGGPDHRHRRSRRGPAGTGSRESAWRLRSSRRRPVSTEGRNTLIRCKRTQSGKIFALFIDHPRRHRLTRANGSPCSSTGDDQDTSPRPCSSTAPRFSLRAGTEQSATTSARRGSTSPAAALNRSSAATAGPPASTPTDFDRCVRAYLEHFAVRTPFGLNTSCAATTAEYRWMHRRQPPHLRPPTAEFVRLHRLLPRHHRPAQHRSRTAQGNRTWAPCSSRQWAKAWSCAMPTARCRVAAARSWACPPTSWIDWSARRRPPHLLRRGRHPCPLTTPDRPAPCARACPDRMLGIDPRRQPALAGSTQTFFDDDDPARPGARRGDHHRRHHRAPRTHEAAAARLDGVPEQRRGDRRHRRPWAHPVGRLGPSPTSPATRPRAIGQTPRCSAPAIHGRPSTKPCGGT